jgi:hypothetical protein
MNLQQILEISKNANEWEGKDYAEILAKLNMHPKDNSVKLIIEALTSAAELLQKMEYALEIAMGDILYLTRDSTYLATRFSDTIKIIEQALQSQEGSNGEK